MLADWPEQCTCAAAREHQTIVVMTTKWPRRARQVSLSDSVSCSCATTSMHRDGPLVLECGVPVKTARMHTLASPRGTIPTNVLRCESLQHLSTCACERRASPASIAHHLGPVVLAAMFASSACWLGNVDDAAATSFGSIPMQGLLSLMSRTEPQAVRLTDGQSSSQSTRLYREASGASSCSMQRLLRSATTVCAVRRSIISCRGGRQGHLLPVLRYPG
jgi:hypothetical protein